MAECVKSLPPPQEAEEGVRNGREGRQGWLFLRLRREAPNPEVTLSFHLAKSQDGGH